MLLFRCSLAAAKPQPNQPKMLDILILAAMTGIVVSLGGSLFFLVRDRGTTQRTVVSLSVRVALAIVLLALLAFGLIGRFIVPGG